MATETRAFKCTKCQHDVVVDVPEQTIVNLDRVSMLMMVHELVPTCNNCGQAFLFAIAGANLRFGWKPVEFEKQESGIIIPPGGKVM